MDKVKHIQSIYKNVFGKINVDKTQAWLWHLFWDATTVNTLQVSTISLYTLHKHDFHIISFSTEKTSSDKIVCRSRMITCSSFKFRKEMVGYDLRRYWFRLLWWHFFASHVFFWWFFCDHAVVVIGGVCVQKLKILINAGTSQSVLSTPKDLLQICTGQHNIYRNIHVYAI